MATSSDEMKTLTFRRFKDGDNKWKSLTDKIFIADR